MWLSGILTVQAICVFSCSAIKYRGDNIQLIVGFGISCQPCNKPGQPVISRFLHENSYLFSTDKIMAINTHAQF